MSQINPLLGSILQTPQVQRQQSDDKDRQLRRSAEQAKDAASTGDRFEHQVESSEELTPAHEKGKQERRFKRPRRKAPPKPDDGEENPHLDLTA